VRKAFRGVSRGKTGGRGEVRERVRRERVVRRERRIVKVLLRRLGLCFWRGKRSIESNNKPKNSLRLARRRQQGEEGEAGKELYSLPSKQKPETK
jgi:hypothetical protein